MQKLKNLVLPDDVAPDIDRKMITVITKAEQPELFNLLRTLFHAWTEAEELDLDDPPGIWAQVEKFDLDGSFWQMIKTSFAYEEETPTLKNLLLRLFVTDLAHHIKGDVPQSMRGLVLPKSGWANAVVCLAQWRDSTSKGSSYDRLSSDVASILKLDEVLAQYEIEDLTEVMTFLLAEKRIASGLRERVQTTSETIDAVAIQSIATRRQSGHWASSTIGDSKYVPRYALNSVYTALVAAAEFFSLRNKYQQGFDYSSALAMYQAYESELYRFDQLYRHFCEFADIAEAAGWNILKPLRNEVESHYVNWYLTSLALAWGKFMDGEGSLLSKWALPSIINQYKFFERHVQPWLDKGEERRAFVIISDAFRYEAAQELATVLNGKYRFEATLSSQLGVLLPTLRSAWQAYFLTRCSVTKVPMS